MEYAIQCHDVCKQYPHFTLDSIDLQVPTGSVMGFVGPNGAGKSTTLRIIMGLVHQERGTVSVLGHAMPTEQIAAKWHIGFVSEDMRLHPGQTIDFHLRFLASIYPNWDAAYADILLSRFGLTATQKIKGLSHGQRVKASILLALAHKPKLLVFDEPTTGLDPQARHQILDEMSAVLADEDRSILFSSHNTLDVEQLSDQITFINEGKILFSEDKETLLERWRRIRLEVPDGFDMPQVPGIEGTQRNGHIATLTVSTFREGFCEAFSQAGATISRVDRLTLEEIFLTNVPLHGVVKEEAA